MTDLRAKIERDLIAKLESASEGSRELDAEISLAVEAGELVWRQTRYTGEQYPAIKRARENYIGGFAFEHVPHYTTSLDAALTLVPEGLYWIVGHGKTSPNELPFGAIISTPLPHREERGGAEHNASAALALCIASLKAREADRLKEEA